MVSRTGVWQNAETGLGVCMYDYGEADQERCKSGESQLVGVILGELKPNVSCRRFPAGRRSLVVETEALV